MADYAATYVSSNSFSITGDVTDDFITTERVAIDDNGTLKYSSIYSVSFNGINTVIVLTKSILTGPCSTCYVGGIYAGATGNLPPHTHIDDDTGGPYVVGSPAEYEWGEGAYNTSIRFKNQDGTWGEWVDIGGPAGAEFKGNWGTGISYTRMNYVLRDYMMWCCIEAHTSDATTTPNSGVYW